MTIIDGIFDGAMNLFSDLMANGTYDILRPDYASATSQETLKASKIGVPVDPATSNIEARIPGVDYYVIGLAASRVEVGDVIDPNPARPGVASITVRSKDGGGKDIIGFRTDQIGSIIADRTTTLFSNVRYSIVNMLNPEQAFVPEFENNPGFVLERFVFYSRPGVETGNYLKMQSGRTMHLKSVETIGPLMIAIATEKK